VHATLPSKSDQGKHSETRTKKFLLVQNNKKKEPDQKNQKKTEQENQNKKKGRKLQKT